jgi:uncharacterized protein (TIGR02594 family)
MKLMSEEVMSVERTPRHLHPYEWAKREWSTNIKEIPGKDKHNPRIVWYHSFTTLRATDDETPWCSAFMNACAVMGGAFPGTRSAAAISWETYGQEVTLENAQTGDILVFRRKDNTNPRARHVAFLHAKTVVNGKLVLECLGGNQNNSVCIAKYKAEELVAVRRFPV